MNAAIVALEQALAIAENNEPINRGEGNVAQADMERANAIDYRRGLKLLKEAEQASKRLADQDDDMLDAAIDVIRKSGVASTARLQRTLRVGYTRSARMMDILEARGLVGPARGSEPRLVLMMPWGGHPTDGHVDVPGGEGERRPNATYPPGFEDAIMRIPPEEQPAVMNYIHGLERALGIKV